MNNIASMHYARFPSWRDTLVLSISWKDGLLFLILIICIILLIKIIRSNNA